MDKPILRSSSKPEIPKKSPADVLHRPQSALHAQAASPARGSWYSSYLRALNQKKTELPAVQGQQSTKSATLRPSYTPISPLSHKARVLTPAVLSTPPMDSKFRTLSAIASSEKRSLRSKLTDFLQDFELGVVLGQGSFACVRSAVQKSTQTQVAIKTYEKYRLQDPHQNNAVAREIKILSQTSHDNIVSLLRVIDTPKQLHLVMERCAGQSLLNYMRQKEGRKVPEPEAKFIFRQILAALEYLHSREVAHRDIKLQNVLVDEFLHVHLIDFGCATEGSSRSRVYCGTPHYMSPELLERKEFSGCGADMWAVGVLLFSLLTGDFPFKGSNDRSLALRIKSASVTFPQYLSEDAKKCVAAMLCADPNARSTARALMNHTWLTATAHKHQVADEGLRPATTPVLLYQRGNAFGGRVEPEASYKRLLEVRTATK